MMRGIRIALAKGRLAEKTVNLLQSAGYHIPEEFWNSRKLIFTVEGENLELILVKPADVPIYVEYGAADLGVVGKDTLLETGCALYEVLDLGFGQCKLALAGLPEHGDEELYKRVATKYPRFAREYFQKKGEPVEIIQLSGSIELAPLTGLAEWIVDIVETGRTLQENGLVIREEICPLSARLVVNRVSMKTRQTEVQELIQRLQIQLERSGIQ